MWHAGGVDFLPCHALAQSPPAACACSDCPLATLPLTALGGHLPHTPSGLMPLKLSLCGATALKQEAVSALLRLPILASIDTGGCVKLTPMDRMRLVAKVKAGQGMLDSKRGGAGTGAAGPSGGGAQRLPQVP